MLAIRYFWFLILKSEGHLERIVEEEENQLLARDQM